jgi:hypothetical protein
VRLRSNDKPSGQSTLIRREVDLRFTVRTMKLTAFGGSVWPHREDDGVETQFTQHRWWLSGGDWPSYPRTRVVCHGQAA